MLVRFFALAAFVNIFAVAQDVNDKPVPTVASITQTTETDPISDAVWRWECISGRCEKQLITNDTRDTALSMSACKMFCNDYGGMWPKPTKTFSMGDYLIHVNRNSIDTTMSRQDGPANDLMLPAFKRFKSHIEAMAPTDVKIVEGGKSLIIFVNVVERNNIGLTLDTNEGYRLEIAPMQDGRVNATIEAENFFGARNALETLEQFIIFDEIRLEMQMPQKLLIEDKPVYPYRGILLDTARNFYSVDSIKRTLDAMGSSKLNTFHWHITDSQSFPFYSKSQPNLTRLGTLSPAKVYSPSQISEIVRYGLERGIRVLPEFDAPAHVGEGWQGTNLTVCFKAEPWQSFCVEPPCGQLNPIKDQLYEVLEDIYNDMFELFKPDIFHMGGDEVKNSCWNTSDEIRGWMLQKGWTLDNEGFLKLWEYFQAKAQEKVYKANGGKKLPLILWTSTLTDFNHIDKYLNKEDYIIQIWTTGTDVQIPGLLKKGYKLIMSNYDALYFDCGFASWVGEGNNWCSPYIGWQKVYDNSPATIAGEHKDLILGGEAALWSEQADSTVLDSRLWPRAAALAERLWAEPETGWRLAEKRMLHFRERLVKMGIAANSIQPEWCYLNEGLCYESTQF